MDMLVNIDVPDLAGAEAFYCNAFGLRPGRRFGEAALELTGGSVTLYLLVKEEGSAPTPQGAGVRSYSRHWSPVHLDFVVADIAAATHKAVAAGAVPEAPVKIARWGKLATFADPFGHGFCLIEFLGRGYDEIADAETTQADASNDEDLREQVGTGNAAKHGGTPCNC
jgi:predicted enzyme related to lactoylglutathione lyase